VVDRNLTAAPPPDAEPSPDGDTAPASGDPAHLADPRAITILSTEHWSLLTARSLVYNETFTRGGMFLTLLSASLVALGFVYQGGGGGSEFLGVVIAVLLLDLFVGVATLGRIISASIEEFRALQAMARIRHAYLEMVPTLDPYISTSRYDDADSVLSVYGPGGAQGPLLNLLHGLTTMPGMLTVINSTLVAALGSTVALLLGASAVVALVVGIAVGTAALLTFSVYAIRTFGNISRFLAPRFPPPPPVAPPAP
jgi:hypothetical protein